MDRVIGSQHLTSGAKEKLTRNIIALAESGQSPKDA